MAFQSLFDYQYPFYDTDGHESRPDDPSASIDVSTVKSFKFFARHGPHAPDLRDTIQVNTDGIYRAAWGVFFAHLAADLSGGEDGVIWASLASYDIASHEGAVLFAMPSKMDWLSGVADMDVDQFDDQLEELAAIVSVEDQPTLVSSGDLTAVIFLTTSTDLPDVVNIDAELLTPCPVLPGMLGGHGGLAAANLLLRPREDPPCVRCGADDSQLIQLCQSCILATADTSDAGEEPTPSAGAPDQPAPQQQKKKKNKKKRARRRGKPNPKAVPIEGPEPAEGGAPPPA